MLTKIQLEEIKGLQRVCEAEESIQLKLNWDMLHMRVENEVNDFLMYDKGKLVGFIGLYGFGNKIELCGMVAPGYRRRGIFSLLFSDAIRTAKERKCSTILLNAPANSHSAKGFFQSIPCIYSFSEYQMKWEETKLLNSEGVTLRAATPEDSEIEIQLDIECFGFTQEEARRFNNQVKQEHVTQFYMIETAGKSVGKIRLSYFNDQAWIFGFAVFPEFQGKGIGRKSLTQVVMKAHNRRKPIYLEVEAKNTHALRLYESCGFKTFHSQDYYDFKL